MHVRNPLGTPSPSILGRAVLAHAFKKNVNGVSPGHHNTSVSVTSDGSAYLVSNRTSNVNVDPSVALPSLQSLEHPSDRTGDPFPRGGSSPGPPTTRRVLLWDLRWSGWKSGL